MAPLHSLRRALTYLPARDKPRFAYLAGLLICLLLLSGCAQLEGAAGEPQGGDAAGEQREAVEENAPGVDETTEWLLATAVSYLTIFAEAAGALVIGVAIVYALWQYVTRALFHPSEERATDDIRLRLGRSLTVGLEFALAADILKTAVAPTWNVIAQLGAIVVLRTVLNYFLERELQHVEARRADHHLQGAGQEQRRSADRAA